MRTLYRLAYRSVAAELKILSTLARTDLLPGFIELLLFARTSVLTRILHLPIVLAPELLLQHLNQPLPKTFLIVISLVLPIEKCLIPFFLQAPVLIEAEFIGNPVFHYLKDIEQLFQTRQDPLGQADGVELPLVAEQHHIADEFLSDFGGLLLQLGRRLCCRVGRYSPCRTARAVAYINRIANTFMVLR